MTLIREFDESSKLAAGIRYSKREWDLFFTNVPNEDIILGYIEVAPYENAMVIDDKYYIVISINEDDDLIVSGIDGYIDIRNGYIFKMLNGEFYDIKAKKFIKRYNPDENIIERVRNAETIAEFVIIKDEIIKSLSKELVWDSDGGEPGHDIRARPNSFMTYVVRHLSKNKFDVILQLEDSQSIYFQEYYTSYEQAKKFAQEDFEKRTVSC